MEKKPTKNQTNLKVVLVERNHMALETPIIYYNFLNFLRVFFPVLLPDSIFVAINKGITKSAETLLKHSCLRNFPFKMNA